jgi:hypothetical protein
MRLLHNLSILVFAMAFLVLAHQQVSAQRVKQPRPVIEAYRVCNRFQQLFAEDLDFDRAFEATFTKNPARRRALAIADGEFGDLDLASIDDATLIAFYKNQVQLLFLTLLLIDENKKEDSLPERIKDIYDRGRPRTIEEFHLAADLLKQDVAELRTYILNDPSAASRIRDFKSGLMKPFVVPKNYVVKPITSYSKGSVLGVNEPYYQVGDYAVIRERSDMKIVGIRFFSRLF